MLINRFFAFLLLTPAAVIGSAQGAVIAGITPTFATTGAGASGLEFSVKRATTLTGFTFYNGGAADTIDLIDHNAAASTYTVAHFVSLAAGATVRPVTVSWALTPGQDYFLVQTTRSNGKYAVFNLPLPSNADIAITQGVAGRGLGPALTTGGTGNRYWNDFTDLTTASAVPEPAAWALLAGGFGLVGTARRRRRVAA